LSLNIRDAPLKRTVEQPFGDVPLAPTRRAVTGPHFSRYVAPLSACIVRVDIHVAARSHSPFTSTPQTPFQASFVAGCTLLPCSFLIVFFFYSA
jgi:hypothetical protein